MPILIRDPDLEEAFRARLAVEQPDRVSEVWDGVEIMSPLARIEHQALLLWLGAVLLAQIDRSRGDRCTAGGNVSDTPGSRWVDNYRIPDIIVALAGGVAIHRGTHWLGGPDLVVEILSPAEDPALKFDFYASVGCRELMVVDLQPLAVELYCPANGTMILAGRADAAGGIATSVVLPLTYRVVAGPQLEVSHTGTGQTWIF